MLCFVRRVDFFRTKFVCNCLKSNMIKIKYPNFSVLMSLYIKEKADYFNEALASVINQTVIPSEIVIVYDGPVSVDLNSVVERYVCGYPNLIRVIKKPVNKGLGLALADGVKQCRYELIARMDTDDVCREDRFEKQLEEFIKDPSLDICGSHILEFEKNKEKIVAQRRVPLEDKDIKKYQKRRDGFNHMSVMFKKKSVLAAGNYQSCLLMEDTLLWANMFMNGAKGKNIDDYLVYVRIGKDMYERRGGLDYFKKYKAGRLKVFETGYISWMDYKITIIVQFVVAMIPNRIRGLVFKRLLHHKTDESR